MKPNDLKRESRSEAKRVPADRARVNANDKKEAAYWTERFGCTGEELTAAVMKVGVMADHVELQIKDCQHESQNAPRTEV